MGRVNGKVAIVTGGARGLGEAMVRQLVAEGAKVVVADILEEEGSRLAEELGENARFQRLDVRSEEEWNQAVEAAEAAFGPVTILVNNAGVPSICEIEHISEDHFRTVVDINQLGVFFGMKTILPSMRKAGGGSIINLSSVSGLVGKAHSLAYTASKFAVRGMTKVAAVEYGPLNIRVNSIHPGPFRTSMVVRPDGSLQPIVQDLMATLPARRLGKPEELAHIVVLLGSDEIPFATGAEFVIDGGMSCE